MAGHSHFRLPAEEPADFAQRSAGSSRLALIVAAVGLLLALALGFRGYLRGFYFAYLTAFAFFLAIVLGAQFFVLVQHASRAGWSVNVRRVAENLGALASTMAVLSIPIVVSVLLHKGDLYRWALPGDAVVHEAGAHGEKREATPEGMSAGTGGEALAEPVGNQVIQQQLHGDVDGKANLGIEHETDPGHGNRHLDELTASKRPWLSPAMFLLRLVIYFAVWILIGRYFRSHSVQQDADGDYRHTSLMQKWSGVSLIALGLTLTFAAFDLFMSLDPHWYSTMFGVYYFASGAMSFFAAIILVIRLMQRGGYLREAVNPEHYHDLGKFMFAFTFFWGYVTFSQYMLLWYSSIPEELTWMSRHGATTHNMMPPEHHQWQGWAILVLFGCFVIPFAGLLSRHAKRHVPTVTFWAVWVLVFQFCNMIWIVLPELRDGFRWLDLATTVFALVGMGGIFVFALLRNTATARIRPVNDPRVFESAAFVNI